jgi:hypothetical protein
MWKLAGVRSYEKYKENVCVCFRFSKSTPSILPMQFDHSAILKKKTSSHFANTPAVP